MNTEQANQIANKVVEIALKDFKESKNIGAITTIKRKDTVKAQLDWLNSYLTKRGVDIQSYIKRATSILNASKYTGFQLVVES